MKTNPYTTEEKMNALKVRVNTKLDEATDSKAWTLLNNGVSVDTLAAMINAGTLVETHYSLIPLGD